MSAAFETTPSRGVKGPASPAQGAVPPRSAEGAPRRGDAAQQRRGEFQFSSLQYRNRFSRADKLRRFAWEVVWLLAFRPTPRWALHGWRRFLLRAFGARIGAGCRIAPTCRVWAPWNLSMGTLCALGDNVDCYSMDRITIGSKVAVSQRSFLCAGSHDVRSLTRPLVTGPIVIEDHVWIAAESMVHPNVVIREGAVVGARSVVVRDLPAWSVCVGHPCRKIRERVLRERDHA